MERHLFFDLDRTLWDFDRNSEHALKYLFEQTQNIHQLPSFYKFFEVYKAVNTVLWKKYGQGKISKDELRDTRFSKTFFKLGLTNKALGDYFNIEYLNVSPLQKQLFPNTHEVLSQLKTDGYKMHIITNGFKEVQELKIKNCQLEPYFNVIVSSEEIGINKPDRRIFEYALGKAEAKPENSVMIGDDLQVDVIGAEQAGMYGIHFDPRAKNKIRKGDLRIRDLNELPDLIPFIWKN